MLNLKRLIGAAGVAVWAGLAGTAVPAAYGQCGYGWMGSGGLNGLDNSVYALAVYDGRSIAGGDFTDTADGAGTRHIAVWDGNSWSALGSGTSNGTNNTVWALTVYNNELIAGGDFTNAGEVSASRIAKWNDTTLAWSALGSEANNGVIGSVYALAVYNNELIVGGDFTIAGGVAVNNIARWDGTAWSALGNVSGNGVDGPVFALTVYNNELIVGGDFAVAAGAVIVNNIAKWNGTSWSTLGGGMTNGVSSYVNALGIYNTQLVVGGSFITAGGTSAHYIAQWNGSTWSALGNGTSDGADDEVYALASYNGELIAGGLFTTAGGTSANDIARWNGTSWLPLSGRIDNGVNAAVYALSVYNSELIVGGDFTLAGGEFLYYDWARWGYSGVFSATDFNHDCDVDGDDLAVFDGCFTGPGVLYGASWPANCTLTPDGTGHIAADFDQDGDVDQDDFGVFQRCFSGAGRPAELDCAN